MTTSPETSSKADQTPLEFRTTDELFAELERRSSEVLIIQRPHASPENWRIFQRGCKVWTVGAMSVVAKDLTAEMAVRPVPHPVDLSEGGGA